ncbi:Cullin-associated NEDD8-dissociated protein 1, C-terminal part [Cytospora mali]|uniref:Cullin-associated NEDD8-dissociated protein 1, C-terminal part n=1 Tax=Cytospora mali TaxID=578113 RepID=A0A194ULR3_CYTMA|nr:Cullin-associated NEDD8-dissociated protein 1, C-terminal part [Valsa mali var. pyri (nom. inval.)]
MATSIPPNPTSHTVVQLLGKLNDTDPDFRFMALNDLIAVFANAKNDMLHHDYNTAARTIDHVVKALDDQNGEVQNQAIKCLGPLVAKTPANLIAPLIEKLTTLKLQNSVDNSVPALALRNVIEALPRPQPGVPPTKDVTEAYISISRVLMPRLLGRTPQAVKSSSNVRLPPPEQSMIEGEGLFNPDAVDVIIEVVKCFGVMLSPYDEVQALQEVIITLLDNKKATSAVRKKAVIALSILAVYLLDEQLVAFLDRAVTVLKDPKSDPVTQRLYLTIMGSMARSIPYRFGMHIGNVVQLTLAFLAEEDLQGHLEEMGEGDDVGLEFAEVREAALVALEAFLASCPSEMRPYTDDTIAACLRYLKYDPNYAADDDEDMDEEEEEEEDDDFGDDDEFESGGAFDDDDDASWKVRRCAAKAIHTLVSTRSNGDLLDNGVLYSQVAPPLVKRFDEREDNVRLEVISALSVLIRKTGVGIIPDFLLDSTLLDSQSQQPQSRKRRRQSSVVSASARLDGTGLVSPTTEKIPSTGPRADLAKLTPQIVKSSTKLLKGKSIPTRQATMNLLDDLILVQRGGLSDHLDQIVDLIIDATKTTVASTASASLSGSGGAASATPATLRVAALKFLGNIAKTHSSSLLQPHLSKMVSGVAGAVNDRFYKISSQAIVTVEEIGKAITPPRSRMTAQKYKPELSKLYDVIVEKATAVDADAEVRQKAIHALGTLLARTSDAEGAGLLPSDKRNKGLSIISDRLKNETTRLAAVRAVEEISAHPSPNFDPEWVRSVTVELSAQVRKANRALRGSSIQALKHLALSTAGQQAFDQTTIQTLVEALLPIIANADSHLHGATFRILTCLVKVDPKGVVTLEFNAAICDFVQQNVVAAVLDPLLDLVAQIGQSGVGEDLMTRLLKDVGVSGDPSTVGQVIGTLLVASGGTGGVDINSFITEAETAEDKARGSLALSVLGEAALRLGAESPLKAEIFTKHFGDEYDKFSMTAALALGRAAAGNVEVYVPVILQSFHDEGAKQYLLLQSIKEILLQSVDLSKFAQPIWDCLLESSQGEDNKAVCAECIGRLAIVDPETYIPKLDKLLGDPAPAVRGIAVQALRYTFADSGDKFDAVLQNYLISMLTAMLQDTDMDIRRLAMTTFTSAAHNKPDMVLGHLNKLMPFVLQESVIKPELIREVMMGPFKILVDDGLELRKGAYESLYALMEVALSRISIIELYDRIIAGLTDDNDIRALSNLMLSKLAIIDPQETIRRLDTIAEAFRATLSIKLKENAVKQEYEKQEEAARSVLRTTLLVWDKLKGSVSTGQCQVWTTYWDWVSKDFERQLRQLREENDKIGHTYA